MVNTLVVDSFYLVARLSQTDDPEKASELLQSIRYNLEACQKLVDHPELTEKIGKNVAGISAFIDALKDFSAQQKYNQLKKPLTFDIIRMLAEISCTLNPPVPLTLISNIRTDLSKKEQGEEIDKVKLWQSLLRYYEHQSLLLDGLEQYNTSPNKAHNSLFQLVYLDQELSDKFGSSLLVENFVQAYCNYMSRAEDKKVIKDKELEEALAALRKDNEEGQALCKKNLYEPEGISKSTIVTIAVGVGAFLVGGFVGILIGDAAN